MNYCGSYRKLLGNAKAAMIAAVETYNKPALSYREECFVILLLNAWELILKSLLSKNKQSIFYRKRRGEPYRTVSWQEAFRKVEKYIPNGIGARPLRRNLELLGTYRDNAVHFYNAKGFGVLIYALAQTNIKNFRDLLYEAFDIKLEQDINWQILPLGIRPPIDPIAYISDTRLSKERGRGAVRQFLSQLTAAVTELESAGEDTGRLLTVFNVKLESVKKIEAADLVLGVKKAEEGDGTLAIVRVSDPNKTHPLRRKDILGEIVTLHGRPFTQYVFTALVWKYRLKDNPHYCWRATEGVLTKYSRDVIPYIQRLSKRDVTTAVKQYRGYLRSRRKARRRNN